MESLKSGPSFLIQVETSRGEFSAIGGPQKSVLWVGNKWVKVLDLNGYIYTWVSRLEFFWFVAYVRKVNPVYAKSNLHTLAHPHVRIALGKNPCSPILSRAFHSKAFLRVPAA